MQGLDGGKIGCRVLSLDVFGYLVAEISIASLILLMFSQALGDDVGALSFLRE